MKYSHALVLTAGEPDPEGRSVVAVGLLPPTASDGECEAYAEAMEKRIFERLDRPEATDYIEEIFSMLEDGTIVPGDVLMLLVLACSKIYKKYKSPSPFEDLLRMMASDSPSED